MFGSGFIQHESSAQAADIEAFLASVERKAFRSAEIATGNRDDALDIVQDAMMKLVRNYRHKPSEQWGALFTTVLHSTINDWYRKTLSRGRWWGSLKRLQSMDEQSEQQGDRINEVAAPEHVIPQDIFQRQQSLDVLLEALEDLPMRQKQTFLLSCWEGYDVAQTADIMQCSVGSVKTHYSRALHKLRQVLEEVR